MPHTISLHAYIAANLWGSTHACLRCLAALPPQLLPALEKGLCVQRMSGIATATAAMVAACAGTHAKVLETRKTVPGLRVLDKWAVLIGGGCNHRIGLHDMIMIKDNHIAAAGSLRAAVDSACVYSAAQSRSIPIEVETSTIEEVQELLQVLDSGGGKGVTRVMLDNMAEREPSCSGARFAFHAIYSACCWLHLALAMAARLAAALV